ncbi:MAG: aminotransferase class I/II-fold pyridoxal phosphate-dependent enzyme [Saprospiraceae bacterium]|nr:aminotransferase class I/II-fold pyridoxal phosphate-dependent enzyme [Saprospiraceae bacterium]
MTAANASPDTLSSLSERGQQLASNLARIDMELFMQASENLFHPIDNPGGAFPLNVAENSVLADRIQAEFDKILQETRLPLWPLKYTSPTGFSETREIMAQFMRRYFGSPSIQADNLVLSAGASASLEVFSFSIANPGDLVVIPAPAYPMYSNDLGIKSGMLRWDLQTHHDPAGLGSLALVTPADLDRTLKETQAAGKVFKLLLLTSPDNPTGCTYTPQQLEAIADWCIQHQVHLLVNEIYALSQIDTSNPELAKDYNNPQPFQSFARIMADRQSDYLHLIYALSKDFAISGMRLGLIHTLNEALLSSLGNVNIPQLASNLVQWLVLELFKKEDFIASYVAENQQKITESYLVVVRMLRRLGIPYTPSRGSLFVWADLSSYLSAPTAKAEEEFWMQIFLDTQILFTPSEGFQHQKKGLYRIVHTAVPTDHLRIAMDRLEAYLVKIKTRG